MQSIHWLLLDNLANDWDYAANMTKSDATKALEWAQEIGLVRDGRLTAEGRAHLLIHGREKSTD